MKQLLLIILSAAALFSFGNQRVESIALTYNAEDFHLSNIDGHTHISSGLHSLRFDESETLPKLPQIDLFVLIGPNEHFDSLTFVVNDSYQWNHINIAACESPIPTSMEHVDTSYVSRSVSFSDTYISSVNYLGTANIDGYKYLKLIVKPFSYFGNNSILTLNQNMTVNIYISQDNQLMSPATNANSGGGKLFRSYVEEFTVNGDELSERYGHPIAALSYLDSLQIYPYLIITNTNLRSAFQPLANWKTVKGMRAKLLTVEDIVTQYEGNSIPAKIKSAIKDYKEHHSTAYVLIGGDENAVPGQQCYIEYKLSDTTLRDTVQSDLFYSCLNQMSWDSNNDGIATQMDTSVYQGDGVIDIAPSIIVSRLPAETVVGAQSMVEKIIDYERNPINGDWNNNILLTGAKVKYLYTNNGRNESDVERIGHEMYDSLYSYGWNGEITRFFDTYTDMPLGANYNVTIANMITELNKGYSLVHEESHGTLKRWLLEGQSFYRSNARSVNNNKKGTVIVSAACSTNGFDNNETSLSQAFLESATSGIIAYYGSQREGFLFQSPELNSIFLKYVIKDGYHRYGEAAIKARYDYCRNRFNNNYNVDRWLAINVNPMGDPEMPIYVREPQQWSRAIFSFRNNVLTISTNETDQYKACVTSLGDYGESFYLTSRSYDGQASFLGVPDSCRICITSPGYIPYVIDVYKNVYIQNETISENRLIVADQTYIGSNVTNQITHGPVVIESGKVEIQSAGGVILAPGAEILQGASLEIKTN